jgi:hypothetical protein
VDIVYFGEAEGEPHLETNAFAEYKYFPPDDLPNRIAYRHKQVIEDWSKLND